jgi:dihydroflavonol-4-reductase
MSYYLATATAYPKSKAMAEKLIWEFRDKLEGDEKFDVVVINPGLIFGPILSNLMWFYINS